MRASMTGEAVALLRPVLRVESGHLEAVKWLAVLLMLQEHAFRYALDAVPVWSYLLGRLVFPLFVFAFAYGLAAAPWAKIRSILVRMFAWAAVAQLACLLVELPEPRLNVLFTFAFGLLAVHAIACGGSFWRSAALLGPVLLLGQACEFGLIGVGFVFSVVWLSRAEWRSRPGWLLAGFFLLALAIPNGSSFALLAVPVLWLLIRADYRMPRIRGAFYWLYAGQFPVFAAIRAVLT